MAESCFLLHDLLIEVNYVTLLVLTSETCKK